ncbi:O-acetyl-ADP-ribose deacetylase [Vulgatibacter incomptus]|nr:O-acetyl-ADP-ribose deacetylase [Vulgatibacter incomptus]
MGELFLGGRIELLQGDLTKLEVDALVNAANRTLLGGAGLDAAVHRAAGPELLEATRKLGGAAPGEAKITEGFRLPARYVIHAVGPIWHGGKQGEPELLASCYRRSLELARDHELASIAFPAISTGAYRYPVEEATEIALRETRAFLEANALPNRVIFCCFSRYDLDVYRKLASRLLS